MSDETVVGWDGSAPAQRALEWALTRAEAHDGTVLIARVVTVKAGAQGRSTGADATETRLEAAERALGDARRSAQSQHPRLTVASRLLVGLPVEELRSLSDERTLLVVGTHSADESPPPDVWSTGASLAATSHGPVALVPDSATAVDSARTGTVAGVDGSAASHVAAVYASAEAVRRGETFTAVHAWQLPPAWADGRLDEDTLRSLEAVHQGILDMAAAHVQHEFPTLTVKKVLVRQSAVSALREATVRARLLVLGNHGLAMAPRLALGPVSHSLARTVAVPTVIVRTADHSP